MMKSDAAINGSSCIDYITLSSAYSANKFLYIVELYVKIVFFIVMLNRN